MPDADLTQPIRSGMPTYPGDPSVSITDHATFDGDGSPVRAVARYD
ncbi:hypothetical protein ACFQL1_12150 [Halomicroarcula sp. GCM10025709]|nr:hypothetical protein [Halomicroarcula sp. YJ-61-S]